MNNQIEIIKTDIIQWIREWFLKNGEGCNAVIGISGGKDSAVAAALCVEALGADRVIGVMMPDEFQEDIEDSYAVISRLGIRGYEVNIGRATYGIITGTLGALTKQHPHMTLTKQALDNIPARIRMCTLYAISQTLNGRVVNTCNLSENVCGYSTLFGDHAGDFSPFDQLTVTEIKAIGHMLGLPGYIVDKTPSDGLCGKTDEDSLGFTYEVLDKFIRTGVCEDEAVREAIIRRYQDNKFKTDIINIPHYDPHLPNHFANSNI